MAFVDVYDALVTERPYKKAWTHDEATALLMDNAGTQFDIELLEIFQKIYENEITKIEYTSTQKD
jgi:putative two-component system response regulator